MKPDELRELGQSVVAENIAVFERQRQLAAERDEAVAELERAMEERSEAYNDLARIGSHHQNGDSTESESILLEPFTIEDPAGKTVVRNLRAVVRNSYRKSDTPTQELPTPDRVTVSYFLQAEDGDVERGLFQRTESIGETGDSSSGMHELNGQYLTREDFELTKVPAPTDKVSAAGGRSIPIYGPGTYGSKVEADRQRELIEAHTAQILETLRYLGADVPEPQEAAVS